MPTYVYCCGACDHAYEEFRSFSEPSPQVCPKCGEPYGQKFNQDWMKNRPFGWVYGEDHATTFGQQAEYNAKRVGKEQLGMMAAERDARRHRITQLPEGASRVAEDVDTTLPWYRSGEVPGLPKMEQPLDVAEVRNVEGYIVEGTT